MDITLSAAKEFIPKGMVVKTTDQFPDLDALEDSAPKKKKGKKGKNAAEEPAKVKLEDDTVDESLKWKGKPSSFFIMQASQTVNTDMDNNPMNFELNEE